MNFVIELIKAIFSARRNHVIEHRETKRILADELEDLADLMDQVLAATGPDGRISADRVPELDRLRQRNWNRWVSILGTDGFASQDPDEQAEVERCVRIAHAAPGSYIDEIFMVQKGLHGGYIPIEIREHFAVSIDRLRDVVTRMRLNG